MPTKKPAKNSTPKPPVKKEIRTLTLPKSGRIMTYELERKAVQRMRLRMRHDGTLHLSIPTRTTMAAVEAYLSYCEDWYLKATKIMAERGDKHPLGMRSRTPCPTWAACWRWCGRPAPPPVWRRTWPKAA